MKPILFASSATTFNTNGLGRIDCVSCKVTEERNGLYELEMEVTEGADHVSEIEMSSIIVAKPSQGKSNQPFRVYKISKPINGRFVVYAQHISYQLSYIPIMPFSVVASSSACNAVLQAMATNAIETCPFTFWTNVDTVAGYKQTVPASIRSRLGGVAGSVLDQFGGEYEWDGYSVKLWKSRGVTTPSVTLRYGKNITDLNQEENIENTITGIVPYWQSAEGDTTVTLTEKVVESSYASQYPFKRTVPYDFSQDFDDEPTEAQLRARAQAYVNQSGIGIPKVSIKLSFINLGDTVDYKDIAALQVVNLCDVIGVYFEKLDIATTAKVVKTVYNVLSERYESIEIGALRSTLASTVSGNAAGLQEVANNTKSMFKNYNNTVGEIVDNATAWLTGSDGYVMAVKNNDGTWKELLFLDTNDASTAHNVLRINENGIGFSSNGVAGPYTQAWTLDGRLVIGGTNVPSLTVYDNNQNIIFQTSRDGTIWNSANSSMTATGVLSAVGAILTNAEIISSQTTGSGVDVSASDGEIVFKYNGSEIATIMANMYGSNAYLDIMSDHYLSFESDQATWAGETYISRVYVGNNALNLFTGNNGAIDGFDLDWSHHTVQFILGDQYDNLDVDYDGSGAAWLTFDQVWFYGGQGFECIDGVDVENLTRMNVWGD